MVYKINYSDNTKNPILVNDGSLDNTTDLTLIGKSYQGGFGDIVAENFVHLLENFSKPTPPERPIEGQLWYNSQSGQLMVYDTNGVWKTTSGVIVSDNSPTVGLGQSNGDIWLNTSTQEIYIYFENSWNIIGSADKTTRQISTIRTDINGITHKTLEFVVNNKTVAIFSGSNSSWVPNSSGSTIERLSDNTIMVLTYPIVRPGLNLFNRKNIPDVTINQLPPNITTENTRIGDFWYSTQTKEFFIYKEQNVWEKISFDVKIETTTPTDTSNYVAGQFWVDSITNNLYIFDGNSWIKLSEMTPTTKIVSKNRLDTNGISHEVLETIVEGQTISVDSTFNEFWTPADSELLEDGSSMKQFFPTIGSGKNYLIDDSYISFNEETNTVTGAVAGRVPLIRGLAARSRYEGAFQSRSDIRPITLSSSPENLNYQQVAIIEHFISNKQDIPIIFVQYNVNIFHNNLLNYYIRLRRLQGEGISDIDFDSSIQTTLSDNIKNNIVFYNKTTLDIPLYIYKNSNFTNDLTYVIEVAGIGIEGTQADLSVFGTMFHVSRYALGV